MEKEKIEKMIKEQEVKKEQNNQPLSSVKQSSEEQKQSDKKDAKNKLYKVQEPRRKPSQIQTNPQDMDQKENIELHMKQSNNNSPFERNKSAIQDPMVASADKKQKEKTGQCPVTRICLTGGPCAGKTTALSTIETHMKQIGYRVLLVPEAATILNCGGAFIQTPKMTLAYAVKFQISLMKLQMNLEDIFIDIAQTTNQPTIIICDRGVMDGQAYCDENVW